MVSFLNSARIFFEAFSLTVLENDFVFFYREGVFKVDMTNLYFFDLNDQTCCILVPDDIDHA